MSASMSTPARRLPSAPDPPAPYRPSAAFFPLTERRLFLFRFPAPFRRFGASGANRASPPRPCTRARPRPPRRRATSANARARRPCRRPPSRTARFPRRTPCGGAPRRPAAGRATRTAGGSGRRRACTRTAEVRLGVLAAHGARAPEVAPRGDALEGARRGVRFKVAGAHAREARVSRVGVPGQATHARRRGSNRARSARGRTGAPNRDSRGPRGPCATESLSSSIRVPPSRRRRERARRRETRARTKPRKARACTARV